jgi:serine/threonine protein kinase/regulator of sirC expression with transglutaminase-like and TPR domain
LADSTDARLLLLQRRKKILIAEKKWAKAVAVVQEIVTMTPTAEHWNQLGFLFLQLQNYNEAAASFSQALGLAPNSQQARDGLARAQTQGQVSTGHGLSATTEVSPGRAVKAQEEPLPRLGRYQIRQELGRGGMGIVYHAYDSERKQEVAIKTLAAGSDSHLLERFTREVETMKKLIHPNIVRIYEVGNDQGRPYFSMEFIRGQSLAQKLKSEKMPVRQVVELMRQVTETVAYAHSRGILHRDIKPANIMLDEEGNPHVMDFGLALDTSSQARLSYTGIAIGTPVYMPPEQALGKKKEIDEKSDVYALGVVLYELLTGTPPFHAPGAQLLQQILHQEPPLPSQVRSGVPQELDRVCLKAMAKVKPDRYQTAGELAADLERFLQRKPVNAKLSLRRRTWKRWWPKKRQQTILYAGLIVLLLVALSLVAYLWQHWRTLTRPSKISTPTRTGQQKLPTTPTRTDQQELHTIMRLLVNAEFTYELQRQSVLHLVAGKNDGSVETLLPYTDSPHFAQRLVAIEALGKIAVRKARFGHDSLGERLLARLDKLNIKDAREAEEAEAIVWALGRLAEPRAESKVSELRWQAGEDSAFWENTKRPYALLPLDPLPADADAQAFYRHGAALLAKESFTGALADLTTAIARDANLAEAYMARGRVYCQLREYARGREDFESAVARRPHLAIAYHFRGAAKSALGDHWGGLADLNKAVALDPHLARAYNNRGVVRYKCGDNEGAIKDFNQTLYLCPEYMNAYINRVVVYREQGKMQEAISDLNEALRINPRYVEGYAGRAGFRYDQNDLDGAIADGSRAIALDHLCITAYINRAVAREAKKDYAGAISDCDEAIRLDQGDYLPYLNRARSRMALGDDEGVISDCGKAIALMPNHAASYRLRGDAWRRQNKHREAANDYRDYLKLSPTADDAAVIREYIQAQESSD